MMPLLLTDRQPLLPERMDDPHCNREKLFNTYRYFATVNTLLSRWRSIYRRYIRPELSQSRTTTLLDIGSGGGDIPHKLHHWAEAESLDLHITATDTDPRALEYVRQNGNDTAAIEYLQGSARKLLEEGRRFDFVISNHLVHHLSDQQLLEMAGTARGLSTRRVLFNDIERGDLGYVLFGTITFPFFPRSFIREDGLTSIRRSFTRSELRGLLPDGWTVKPLFPYRMLMVYTHDKS